MFYPKTKSKNLIQDIVKLMLEQTQERPKKAYIWCTLTLAGDSMKCVRKIDFALLLLKFF